LNLRINESCVGTTTLDKAGGLRLRGGVLWDRQRDGSAHKSLPEPPIHLGGALLLKGRDGLFLPKGKGTKTLQSQREKFLSTGLLKTLRCNEGEGFFLHEKWESCFLRGEGGVRESLDLGKKLIPGKGGDAIGRKKGIFLYRSLEKNALIYSQNLGI